MGKDELKEGKGHGYKRAGAEKLGGSAEFYTEEDEGMEIKLILPAHLNKGENND